MYCTSSCKLAVSLQMIGNQEQLHYQNPVICLKAGTIWDDLWRDDVRLGQMGRENISLSIMWSHVTAVHAGPIPKTLMGIWDECWSYIGHNLWLRLSISDSLLFEIWRILWFPCWLGWICQNHLLCYRGAECIQTVYTLLLAMYATSACMCSCVQVGDKSM